MNNRGEHPLFLRGIEQFNRCEFFQCHETWEELWLEDRGTSRLFYKGLIQAAVALFHVGNGNRHGAEKLLAGACSYLAPYRPEYLGLDVERFLSELSRYITQAIATGQGTGLPLVDSRQIPKIHLQRKEPSDRDVSYPWKGQNQ